MNPLVMAPLWFVLLALSATVTQAVQPHKSPNDPRNYQIIELENGLQAVLVSEPNARRAAVALDVGVGSAQDPTGRQGLAHFLEHMLFLGTEKYPDSGAYQGFINSHGGSHNAYTSFEHTNYFFDVDAAYLEPALDRFAQFFIAPLFNADYVEREIQAVESEYRAKLKSDARRSLDVFKAIINPEHPFSKLSVGNLQTLLGGAQAEGSEVSTHQRASVLAALRSDLIDFYDTYYHAGAMRLAVLGPQSLSELEQLARAKFKAVRKQSVTKSAAAVPLFTQQDLPRQVALAPEKNTRSLAITFPIPAIRPHYRFKPEQYIGNIIGHEGQGSLLANLKRLGWAEGLSAGAGLEYPGGATFNVSISLTEAGLAHVDDILAGLFALIEMIERDGLQAWRYQEQADLLSIAFRFQEQSKAIRTVSRLAGDLHRYPAQDLLRGAYQMDRYKPQLIRQFLGHLKPGNALITLMAPDLEHSQTSPWYATPYSVSPVSGERLDHWRSPLDQFALKLPRENPFIANDFRLEKTVRGAEVPVNLAADYPVWWADGGEFRIPKAEWLFEINSLTAAGDARQAALTMLYAAVLSDALNEYSYPALLAGIGFRVARSIDGLSIRVGGFDDRQPLLLEKIASTLKSPGVSEPRLLALHAELSRQWENAAKRLPYQQLVRRLKETMIDGVWAPEALSQALPDITLQEFEQFIEEFLNSAELEALVVGNVSRRAAKAGASSLAKTLRCGREHGCTPPQGRVQQLALADPHGLSVSIDHADSAVMQYIQASDGSDLARAQVSMSAQMLKAGYFQQLRTEQQLGYVVFVSPMSLLHIPGLAFLVQSPSYPVGRIQAATDEFITARRKQLHGDGSAALFEKQRSALLSQLQEKPKNLFERAQRFWSDIQLHDYSFDRRMRLIEAVEQLDYARWRRYFLDDIKGGLLLWSTGDRAEGDYLKDLPRINRQSLRAMGGYFQLGETKVQQ